MAEFRDNFFAQLDAGARWSVPVAINRNNPLPLDDNSVFRSEADLDAYVSGPLAYPGHVVALVEAEKTTIYYIDQDGELQEVGKSFTSDGNTVVINNGNISLANMPTDTTKTYNATLVNGVLTWVEPSATTVEGLDTRLTAAEGQIVTLNQQVAELGKAFEFKGTANSISADGKTIYDAEGKAITAAIGDVYQIGDKEYAYNGSEWVELGFNVDLSGYATDEELSAVDTKAGNAATAASNAQTAADEAKTAAGNAQTKADEAYELAATKTTMAEVEGKGYALAADTATKTALEAVGEVAEAAKSAASTNATAIGSLQELVNTQGGKITTLEEAKDDHAGRLTTVEGIVAGHVTKIGAIEENVNTNSGDIATLKSDVATAKGTIESHTNSLAELAATVGGHTTSIAGIQATVEAAATKTALESEISRAQAAEKVNADAIAALATRVGDSETDITELKALVGEPAEGETAATGLHKAIADEASRAAAAEKVNADAIAQLIEDLDDITNIMNFRGVYESIEDVEDPKSGDVIIIGEQEWVYNGTTWELFGDASGNAAAITELTKRVEANETAVKTTLPGAITQALTDAKAYTDAQITAKAPAAASNTVLGLIKGVAPVEGVLTGVSIENGNVTGVSTDLLVQGANELILNGGSAN